MIVSRPLSASGSGFCLFLEAIVIVQLLFKYSHMVGAFLQLAL